MRTDRSYDCFLAGVKTKEIDNTVVSAITWLEHRDAQLAASALWNIGQQAGTLSVLVKGAARTRARELAAGVRKMREGVKVMKGLIPKKKAKEMLSRFLRLKDKYNLSKDVAGYCTGRKPKK